MLVWLQASALSSFSLSPTTVSPTISSLTYQEEFRTLTCVSTGSPATTVSWMRDGQSLIIDDSTYHLTQTITDRSSSTYSNVLTVSDPSGVAGTYNCTVTNDLGSDSREVEAVGTYELQLKETYLSGNFLCNRYHTIWSGAASDSRPVCHHQLYD